MAVKGTVAVARPHFSPRFICPEFARDSARLGSRLFFLFCASASASASLRPYERETTRHFCKSPKPLRPFALVRSCSLCRAQSEENNLPPYLNFNFRKRIRKSREETRSTDWQIVSATSIELCFTMFYNPCTTFGSIGDIPLPENGCQRELSPMFPIVTLLGKALGHHDNYSLPIAFHRHIMDTSFIHKEDSSLRKRARRDSAKLSNDRILDMCRLLARAIIIHASLCCSGSDLPRRDSNPKAFRRVAIINVNGCIVSPKASGSLLRQISPSLFLSITRLSVVMSVCFRVAN